MNDTDELTALKAEASGELERMATAPVALVVDAPTLMLLSALCSSALANEPAPPELQPAARQFLDAVSAKLLAAGFPAISEVMWALVGEEEEGGPPTATHVSSRALADINARCQRLARLISTLRSEGLCHAIAQPVATLAALRWVLHSSMSPRQSEVAAMAYIRELESEA